MWVGGVAPVGQQSFQSGPSSPVYPLRTVILSRGPWHGCLCGGTSSALFTLQRFKCQVRGWSWSLCNSTSLLLRVTFKTHVMCRENTGNTANVQFREELEDCGQWDCPWLVPGVKVQLPLHTGYFSMPRCCPACGCSLVPSDSFAHSSLTFLT